MATFAIGLSDIKLKITKINGVTYPGSGTASAFNASGGVSIGEVMEGSTQITDEAPNELKFKGDYSDATLKAIMQRGDFAIETDIIEVDAAKFADLTGGTYSSGTKTVTIPNTAPSIEGEVTLVFDEGISQIKLGRAQIIANYSAANIKTELFKLHLKVIALEDSGKIGTITFV